MIESSKCYAAVEVLLAVVTHGFDVAFVVSCVLHERQPRPQTFMRWSPTSRVRSRYRLGGVIQVSRVE